MYAKNPNKAKYPLLIIKRETLGLKNINRIYWYSSDINNIYENIDDQNSNKKRKISIVFDTMIADMLINKLIQPIIAELLKVVSMVWVAYSKE